MSIFKQVFEWLKKQIAGTFVEAQEHAIVAVKITNILKSMVESPITQYIVNLTPTTTDNKILDIAKKWIPDIAAKTLLAYGIIVQSKTMSECLGRLADYIKTLPMDERGKFYVDFCAKLNGMFADGVLDYAESVAITQMIFRKLFPHQP